MTQAWALDVSHHSGEIREAQWLKAKERNVRRVIVGVNRNQIPIALRQMAAAHKAGLEVEAYVYTYFRVAVQDQYNPVIKALPEYVKRLWVDVEDVNSGYTPAQITAVVKGALSLVRQAGLQTGIYTAKWWWDAYMPGVTAFKDEDLWDAWWNDKHDMNMRPYGGWTSAVMRQIRGDMFFNDIWCDLNIYMQESAPMPLPPAPPTYTAEDVERAFTAGRLDGWGAALRQVAEGVENLRVTGP